MKSLIDVLSKDVSLGRPLAMMVVIVGLFALAWLVGRIAVRVAAFLVDRSERRSRGGADAFDTGVITGIRQRETAIS
ncbi:MAG: hypothetical protein ACXVZL_08905, partial [Gaiellaceae bacterium]